MRKREKKARRFAKLLRGRMSNAEVILWSRLRCNGMPNVRFRRQHPIGPYIADFACVDAGLVVEVDGATHATDDERKYDARRERFLRKSGLRIVRVTNEDVYKRLANVLDAIYVALPPPRASHGPPP